MVLFFLTFLMYNEIMRELYKLISSINKKCDLENKSIFECLQELAISINQFLNLFTAITIIDGLFREELCFLLKNKSTRIYIDPNFDKDSEIEINSSELNTSISLLPNTVKIIWGSIVEDEKYLYYHSKYYAITQDEKLKTIHFESHVTKEKSKIKMSGNYKLAQATIKLSDNTDSLEVTIIDDLLMKDLQNIYRILYNFNYELASNILKLYPSQNKTIKSGIPMNNFHTR